MIHEQDAATIGVDRHHACIRCPFLRLDPAQTPRLDTIEANTRDRLTEARGHQWLGEIAALEESLRHIREKRSQLQTPATRP
jgi:hypothetical protein